MARRPVRLFDIRFDAARPEAVAAAERYAAKLVTNVSASTRAAIRAMIAKAIREGIPPYDAARILRGMIGMNEQQAVAALNYRSSLLNQGIALDRVEKLYSRFVAKKIRQRAMLIARTEIMRALNHGKLAGWKQLRGDGWLSNNAIKQLYVSPDACEVCMNIGADASDGIPLSKDFSPGFDAPPFHPACRCTMTVSEPTARRIAERREIESVWPDLLTEVG